MADNLYETNNIKNKSNYSDINDNYERDLNKDLKNKYLQSDYKQPSNNNLFCNSNKYKNNSNKFESNYYKNEFSSTYKLLLDKYNKNNYNSNIDFDSIKYKNTNNFEKIGNNSKERFSQDYIPYYNYKEYNSFNDNNSINPNYALKNENQSPLTSIRIKYQIDRDENNNINYFVYNPKVNEEFNNKMNSANYNNKYRNNKNINYKAPQKEFNNYSTNYTTNNNFFLDYNNYNSFSNIKENGLLIKTKSILNNTNFEEDSNPQTNKYIKNNNSSYNMFNTYKYNILNNDDNNNNQLIKYNNNDNSNIIFNNINKNNLTFNKNNFKKKGNYSYTPQIRRANPFIKKSFLEDSSETFNLSNKTAKFISYNNNINDKIKYNNNKNFFNSTNIKGDNQNIKNSNNNTNKSNNINKNFKNIINKQYKKKINREIIKPYKYICCKTNMPKNKNTNKVYKIDYKESMPIKKIKNIPIKKIENFAIKKINYNLKKTPLIISYKPLNNKSTPKIRNFQKIKKPYFYKEYQMEQRKKNIKKINLLNYSKIMTDLINKNSKTFF